MRAPLVYGARLALGLWIILIFVMLAACSRPEAVKTQPHAVNSGYEAVTDVLLLAADRADAAGDTQRAERLRIEALQITPY